MITTINFLWLYILPTSAIIILKYAFNLIKFQKRIMLFLLKKYIYKINLQINVSRQICETT